MKGLYFAVALFAVAAAVFAAKPPDVQVVEAKCHRTEDKVTLDGKVKITGEKPLKGLVLEFVFLSDSAQVLTTQKTEVSDETIRKDEEESFHVEAYNTPGSIRYKIRAYDSADKELRIGNDGPFIIE